MDSFKDLNKEQWLALLPFGIACGLVGFGAKTLLDKKVLRSLSMQLKHASQMGKVNPAVKKSESKVVDSVDIEDLGDKKVFCRCWRSSKFPYCDGTHNKYNEDGGDNVGPLIVKKKGI